MLTLNDIIRLALLLTVFTLTACIHSDDDDDDRSKPGGQGNSGARMTIIVAVVDSLMPDEIGGALTPTPTLVSLRDSGTFYNESRSVFSAETIPNHVAMMTGVYPDRNGIPTNNYWDRGAGEVDTDLSLPSEVEVDSLFTRIKQQCPDLRTAAIMSKDYLYEVFSACGFSGQDCGRNLEPDIHFDPTSDPTFLPQPAGLVPDMTTMQQALSALPDTDFMFINLGQVDRMGHADESGNTGVPIQRNAVLLDTDTQIGMLVQMLKDQGRWDNTVMIVLSDHGMDWSLLADFINTQPVLDSIGGLVAVDNGGTNSVYLTDQTERGTPAGNARLKQARDALLQVSGIKDVWYVFDNPQDPGVEKQLSTYFDSAHENMGDLVLSATDGFRFSEPGEENNPIPGNHGHEETYHNTFMISGGAAFLKAQVVSELDEPVSHMERRTGQSENVDVAPTVAWLLGMPVSGYDGRVLREAFNLAVPPSQCGVLP